MIYVKFAIAGLPKHILLMILSLVMIARKNLQVATLLIYSLPTKMFTCSPVFITLFSLGSIETHTFTSNFDSFCQSNHILFSTSRMVAYAYHTHPYHSVNFNRTNFGVQISLLNIECKSLLLRYYVYWLVHFKIIYCKR
jgi:hypothetical protein